MCSWARMEHEPVKGWTAKPTRIRQWDPGRIRYTESYLVIKCPEYVADERKR